MSALLFNANTSLRRRAIATIVLGIAAFATSGFAMASDASQPQSSGFYRAGLQMKIMPNQGHGEAGNRDDWNSDYPSQLPPQSVPPAQDATTGKMAAVSTAASSPAR